MAGKLISAALSGFGAKKKAGGNRASADRLKGLAGGFVGAKGGGGGGLLKGAGGLFAGGGAGDVIGPSRKPGKRLAKGRLDVKPGRRLGRGKGGRRANLPGIPEIPSIGGDGGGGKKRTRR